MLALLQDWITIQAERRSTSVAVVGGTETLSYADLEILSNRLARLLRAAGCEKGDRVCLLMPKSPLAIASLLGIYKAGGIYVPLDPSSPPARLVKIIAACGSKLILTSSCVCALWDGSLGELIAAGRIQVGWIDRDPAPALDRLRPTFTLDQAPACSGEPIQPETRRSDAAHILFTSGSTGTPKGVIITHDNVIHFIEWAVRYFRLTESDRNSGHPPLPFDLSFLDIFATFAAGAQLHLVPPEINVAPARLAAFIRSSELTQWFSVPSVMHYMAKFDAVGWNDFPKLKRVLWCGEVLPTPTLIHWMQRLPRVQFTNLYGPTEATIASSYYTVPECPQDELAAIPIGRPCDGEELLVLDDQLQRTPPGTPGQLYIRGSGLSRGYWNDPETTNRVFIPDPSSSDPSARIYNTGDMAQVGEDGMVYFLGRNDTQIKSHGYRIELGEIEAALNSLPEVREAAVVAIGATESDSSCICCAYVPAPGTQLPPVALRKLLSRLLPSYMLPVRWRILDMLPKNGSGKLDRRTLKDELLRQEAPLAGTSRLSHAAGDGADTSPE